MVLSPNPNPTAISSHFKRSFYMNLVTALFLLLLPLAAIPQSPPVTSLNSQPDKGSTSPSSIPHVSVCSQPDKSSELAILTICTHERGMTALPQPRLYLRVFADGRGEFETNGKRLDTLVLKEVRLTEGELNEIVCLGRESDFQEANASYPAIHSGIDSSRKTTVTFRDGGPGYDPKDGTKKVKTIVVSNYYSAREDNFEHYPSSFNALMDRAETIWKRAMGIAGPKPQIASRQSGESSESGEFGVRSSEFGVPTSVGLARSKDPQSAIRNPQSEVPQSTLRTPHSKDPQSIRFCDLLKDPTIHVGHEVTLHAIFEHHVTTTRDGKRFHRSEYLHDPECEMDTARDPMIGAEYTRDMTHAEMLQALTRQVETNPYNGHVRVVVTGTLRDTRDKQPPDYPYSFEITDIKSTTPAVLAYRGRLLNGWTFSDTFEVTRADLTGSSSSSSPPYEGGVASASDDGVVLSSPAKTQPATNKSTAHLPKVEPSEGIAASLIKLSSPLKPINGNPYWPKGSLVEPRIEWRNPADFRALFQPGRKQIIFRISHVTTAGVGKNQFTETYTCEILSLVSSQSR
jgi:hypothetical protein